MPPSEGDSNVKKKCGNEHNWRECHQAWVLHSPDECKKNPDHTDSSKDKKSFAAKISKMLAEEGSDSE